MTTKPKRLLTKTPEITWDDSVIILRALDDYARKTSTDGQRKQRAQELRELLMVAEQITVAPETPQEQL